MIMSYKVTFPNDYGYIKIPDIDGFKLDKEFDDVVFGWFGDTYIKVEKDSYEKYLNEVQEGE